MATKHALERLVAKCLCHGDDTSATLMDQNHERTALTEADLRQLKEAGGCRKPKKQEEEVCKVLHAEAHFFANKNILDGDIEIDVFLSQLLSKLSVIFDNKDEHISSAAIARALHLVKGILDGACLDKYHVPPSSSGMTSEAKSLIGRFLIRFCGYGTEKMSNDDNDIGDNHIFARSEEAATRVQTVALDCLASLLNWRSATEMPSLSLTLAHNGVESYLGIEAKGKEQDTDSSEYSACVSTKMASLVRIQRSKCTSLLQTAVDQFSVGVSLFQQADPTVSSTTRAKKSFPELLHHYAILCASCIQGETDPRCIKQLMTLVHATQTTFCSPAVHCWLENISGAGNGVYEFPTVAVFDSVAPYYPIRFTPPPSDPHGITRSELREALSLVLCHPSRRFTCDSDEEHHLLEDDNEKIITMTCLACEIFLEQMEVIPQDRETEGDYGGSSVNSENISQDYLEACEDLTRLLFFTPRSLLKATDEAKSGVMLFHLPRKVMTNVSDALLDVFIKEMYHHITAQHVERQLGDNDETVDDDASSRNAISSKPKGTPASIACLELASRLARELEVGGPTYKIREDLWEAFHATVMLQNLARTVTTTPEGVNGKIGIAYLCRLAQCGLKARTKWLVDICMPPLMDKVLQYKQDRRQYLAEQEWYPRDVATFPSDAQRSDGEAVANKNDRVQATLLALSACLTAYSTPLDSQAGSWTTPHLSTTYVTRLERIFDALIELGFLLLSKDHDGSCGRLSLHAVSPAAINTLECLLCSMTPGILDPDKLSSATCSLLKICCGADVMSTKEKDVPGNFSLLHAWQASCAHALGSIFGIMAGRKEALLHQGDSLHTVGEALEIFLDEVVTYVTSNTSNTRAALAALARACDSNKSMSDLVFAKLISKLARCDEADMLTSPQACIQSLAYILSYAGNFARNAWFKLVDSNSAVIKELMELFVSQRTTRSVLDVASNEFCQARRLLSPLAVCLKQLSGSRKTGQTLVSFVLDLKVSDENEHCKAFFVIGGLYAFFSGPHANENRNENFDKSLAAALPVLIEYLLNKGDETTKAAAAGCIFPILVSSKNDEIYHSAQITRNFLYGCSLQDELNVRGIVGGAAAGRGGTLAPLGDRFARLLLSLCVGEQPDDLSLKDFDDSVRSRLPITGSVAFGTMFTFQGGSPFWRQRISAQVLPTLLERIKATSLKGPTSKTTVHFSCVSVLSHIVCSSPLVALGDRRQVMDLTGLLVHGLTIYVPLYSANDRVDITKSELLSLYTRSVAGILRNISCMTSGELQSIGRLESLVEVFLLLVALESTYLTEASDTGVCFISGILLTLQSLLTLAETTHTLTFSKGLQKTVVNVCGRALDHRSHLVREAAARVRNAWVSF